MINLFEYVSSFDFIDDIPASSLIIISDKEPTKKLQTPFQYYHISDILKGEKFITQDPILVICHNIGIQDIITLQKLINGPITRINLNPGLMSMLTKNNPEVDDIVVALAHHYTVVEPISRDHFLHSLQSNVYMRIYDTFLPETLQQVQWNEWYGKIVDSEWKSDYIVLTSPAHIDEVASSLYHLAQSDEQDQYDLYVQHTFSNKLSVELIADIQRTQHIIIIIDHKATEQLWMFYDILIKEQTQTKDITIQYIFPQYHLVSSILPEYLYEEAQFDQIAFLEYITQTRI